MQEMGNEPLARPAEDGDDNDAASKVSWDDVRELHDFDELEAEFGQ